MKELCSLRRRMRPRAGIAISTAPATVLAIVKETRSKGIYVRTLIAAVALNNLACIFLFEVAEDATQRNRPPSQGIGAGDVSLARPPLALVLRYLLTPWSGDRLTDHRILGRTLQTLYE